MVLGLPWYDGPNVDTYVSYFDFLLYMGSLAERTILRHKLGKEVFDELALPPLATDGDLLAEPTVEDYDRLGRLRIALVDYSRTSLVGKAREIIAESAVNIGADYLFWWDADMQFPYSAFLRLFRHNKPIVGALAFAARDPIFPCIFGVTKHMETDGRTRYQHSSPIFNYPKDRLIGDEDLGGGWLAMGGAVTLIDCGVFSEIPQPWFNSTSVGEDWFFCARAADHGIPRYCDTSVIARHKAHAPRWYDDKTYWRARRDTPEIFSERWQGELVLPEDLDERL